MDWIGIAQTGRRPTPILPVIEQRIGIDLFIALSQRLKARTGEEESSQDNMFRRRFQSRPFIF